MTNRVTNINSNVLRACRKQIGLTIPFVQKKVSKIDSIEKNETYPTFKQLETLSHLYKVPRWVFIASELPPQYNYSLNFSSFRTLPRSNSEIFSNTKVKTITAQVEKFRELLIDLRDDLQDPVTLFDLPIIDKKATPIQAGKIIRKWLGITKKGTNFDEWKKLLEDKGIFIFMTSKYKGWSHIDLAEFRGMSIYHSKVPIIVINDSDSKKARSFSLIHELGHIVRQESTIDDWNENNKKIEKWCDKLAGCVLMPNESFRTDSGSISDLNSVKKVAKIYSVSTYACLVNLYQLNIITKAQYDQLESELFNEYDILRKKLQANDGGPARNRPKEVLHQYGHLYVGTLLQAFRSNEIGLSKVTKLLDLKKPSMVFDIETTI